VKEEKLNENKKCIIKERGKKRGEMRNRTMEMRRSRMKRSKRKWKCRWEKKRIIS
jgi:hypothetical protein